MTELEKLSLSQPLTDVYNAMEQDIMLAIAKQLAKGGSISASSEWRLQRLAEAGDLNKTVIGIIASYTGIQSELLTEALSGAANSVIDKLEPGFRELAKQGFISDTPVPASKSVDRAIQTFRKQAASDLNLVNTVMRYKAKQAYVDLVNKTYDAVNAIEDVSNRQELLNTLGKHTMSTVMGAESRSEAVRKCIREFNNKGIPAFVDAAGREWSPEAYINMDIRTTVSNTANAAQDARCDDYGIDLIAVSSHPGARPKCAKDQGKVYSRSNKSGIAHDGNGKEIPYEPLSSTSYGEPDGLFGINCRHKKYPFIDGVNFQRYFPYDKEENDKRYKEIQEQRRLERKVRNTKREADMLKEVGDTEGAKAARAKLKEQRKAYRTYCDEHELTQRSDRLTVSKGSVSASKAQKPLDKYAKGGILKGGYNPHDISQAITQKGTNFVTKDINNPESLYGELVEGIKPKKGYYDIKCHGSPTNVKIFDSVIDANELARIIIMRSDYNGEPIRLLCCETGQGENSFAEQLSKLLGVKVQAPTKSIWISSSGKIEVGTEKGLNDGEMVTFPKSKRKRDKDI